MNHRTKGGRRKGKEFSFFVFAFCCATSAAANAQILNDPTRPPSAVSSPNELGEPGAPAPTLLQSVMITPTERTAIIGGELIKLGGKYGDARVVKITESEVILQSANGSEILRMYPDVSMKPVEPEQPAGMKPAAKKRGPAAATRRTQQ
jgi:MSHA biogenesis protein MshK